MQMGLALPRYATVMRTYQAGSMRRSDEEERSHGCRCRQPGTRTARARARAHSHATWHRILSAAALRVVSRGNEGSEEQQHGAQHGAQPAGSPPVPHFAKLIISGSY